MRTYSLYVESDPTKGTTLVHVLRLLGCVAKGATLDDALAATPNAIRAYLAFLRGHGEVVDPKSAFRTRIVERITEGDLIGQGSPQAVFAPDLRPLSASELWRLVRRLEWSRADLLTLISRVSERDLRAKAQRGRSIYQILRHVGEVEPHYTTPVLGRVKDLTAAGNAIYHARVDIREGLHAERAALVARVRSVTPAERSHVDLGSGRTWTLRRSLRRTLEHEWEHRCEIAARLGRRA